MMPDPPRPTSHLTNVPIFPGPGTQAEVLVITFWEKKKKEAVTPSSLVHLSSSDANATALGSRKQMEPRPSSDQKKKKQGRQSEASVCVSRSLRLFQVSWQKGRKPFLKGIKVSGPASANLRRASDQEIGGRGTGREDTLASFLRPLPAPVFGDQVSYTRGFWSCIIRCSAADERKLQRDALTHRTPQSLTWMPSRPHPHNCHCVSVSAEHARHTKTHAPQTPSAALRGLRWTPGGGAAAVR